MKEFNVQNVLKNTNITNEKVMKEFNVLKVLKNTNITNHLQELRQQAAVLSHPTHVKKNLESMTQISTCT